MITAGSVTAVGGGSCAVLLMGDNLHLHLAGSCGGSWQLAAHILQAELLVFRVQILVLFLHLVHLERSLINEKNIITYAFTSHG